MISRLNPTERYHNTWLVEKINELVDELNDIEQLLPYKKLEPIYGGIINDEGIRPKEKITTKDCQAYADQAVKNELSDYKKRLIEELTSGTNWGNFTVPDAIKIVEETS